MRYLLDTHSFLWWITDDQNLSPKARDLISDRRNDLYLSSASGWEIAIKAALGRLKISGDPEKLIPEQMSLNAIEALPIHMPHALRVFTLPGHHRDPFDRILVAQAQLEEMPVITNDSVFEKYDVDLVW